MDLRAFKNWRVEVTVALAKLTLAIASGRLKTGQHRESHLTRSLGRADHRAHRAIGRVGRIRP